LRNLFATFFCILLFALPSSLVAAPAAYTPEECPVIGNTNSKIYHMAGGQSYAKMLRKNKNGDNRDCFQTEELATAAGYRKSKR
jgi:hypothetical protein